MDLQAVAEHLLQLRHNPGWIALMNLLQEEHDAALEEMIEADPATELEKLISAQMTVQRYRWYRGSVEFLLSAILEPEVMEDAFVEPIPGEPLEATEYE